MQKPLKELNLKAQRLFNNLAFLIALVIIIFVLAAGLRLISDYKAESSIICLNERPNQPLYEGKEINEYYEIYYITKYYKPQYLYYIFDKNHELLDYDIMVRMEPEITITSEGLISLYQSIGTSVGRCRYYDPDIRLRSEWFISPFAETRTMVASYEWPWQPTKILVQNIFDKSKYYREFNIDFEKTDMPVISAKFLDNGTRLELIYSAENESEKTIIIDLY